MILKGDRCNKDKDIKIILKGDCCNKDKNKK